MENGVVTIEWPSRSPDANPIENLWAVLGRTVYENGRQFDQIDDLKEALTYAWDNMSTDVLRNLAESMTRRCIDLVEKKGGPIKY